MARSMWKRLVAAALLSAGIGGGYTWMCRAQAPTTAQDTVELSIDGKATTCQLVHSWRDAAGKSLHVVFNQSTGEMLTLVPDGDAGDVRIVHWGVGAQTPPPNTPLPQEWKFRDDSLPKVSTTLPEGYAPRTVSPKTPALYHGTSLPNQPTPQIVHGQAMPGPSHATNASARPQGLEVSLVRPQAHMIPPRSATQPSTMSRYTLPDVPATSSLEMPGVPIVGASNPSHFPPPSAYGPLSYRSAIVPSQESGIALSQAKSPEETPPGAPPLPAIKAAPLPDVPTTPGTTPLTVGEISSPVVCDPCVDMSNRGVGGRFPFVHKSRVEVICCPDVLCQDSCTPTSSMPGVTNPKDIAPAKPMPMPMPPKETTTKIPGTNQPWPVGAQSAIAAYGGLQGKVSFLPVPIATIPEPRRIPQPPNLVPQPPQPTRPDPMAFNAFSPTPAEMAAMPPMPYGAMPYGALSPTPYGAAPAMAMNPYAYPNPYGMMGAAPMMTTAGVTAPGYPMMPQGYPMMPQGYPAMPYGVPSAPTAYPYAPAMPPVPTNVAPVQPASFSTSTYAYNNAMDRRIPTTQVAYGPAHAKYLSHYLQVLSESSSPGEREWAANSLAGFDPHAFPTAVSALTHAAGKDVNSGVRAACINNLSRMTLSHEHALRLLGAFRHETDPRVKQEVDRALARLGVTTAAK